ncbi:MAG: arylesterase [Burkholderiaceae bacterium]|nr:arylesterase [Burkholderiaceae bacterium]
MSAAGAPAGRSGRRKLLRLLAGCATAASLPVVGRAAPRGPDAGRTLLVLGDSLSAEYGLRRGSGWVELLSRRLAARRPPWQVVNASISGETTAGGDSRIVELLERHRPAVVVIELGGNDALRGLDLSATEANLADIARAARRSGARVLLLGMKVPPNYGRPYADAFAALFRRVAEREETSLLPFFLDGVAERPDLFQPDRIHPNEKAQQRLLDNVWPALRPLLD